MMKTEGPDVCPRSSIERVLTEHEKPEDIGKQVVKLTQIVFEELASECNMR